MLDRDLDDRCCGSERDQLGVKFHLIDIASTIPTPGIVERPVLIQGRVPGQVDLGIVAVSLRDIHIAEELSNR